jgi:predicted SnoaL-like aldol condensation-catalyzing enzyme
MGANPTANKGIIREFYELAFNQKRPADAAARYLSDKYRQHNPLVGDGRPAFIGYVAAFLQACPDLQLSIKRLVAEGDLVAVHSHLDPGPSHRGTVVMDMFRLEDGRIVEHWDVVQEIPATAANPNTML